MLEERGRWTDFGRNWLRIGLIERGVGIAFGGRVFLGGCIGRVSVVGLKVSDGFGLGHHV